MASQMGREEVRRRESLLRGRGCQLLSKELEARQLTLAQLAPINFCEPGKRLQLREGWPRRGVDEHAVDRMSAWKGCEGE